MKSIIDFAKKEPLATLILVVVFLKIVLMILE